MSLFTGGVCIRGQGGLSLSKGGLHPGGLGRPPGYGQQAGGTHSSGMHRVKIIIRFPFNDFYMNFRT